MRKQKQAPEKLLTDVELELMSILWRLKEGSVADVLGHLPKGRDLAYTSVSTILRILEQKGVLKARKEGRGHVYVPVLLKVEYEVKAVKHVVEKVFDGTPTALVKQLLGSCEIDADDLAELKLMIAKMGDRK